MIRHCVLFRWTPEATEVQKAAVATELGRLPAIISDIRRYRFGADAGLRPGNVDFAVVADFDDAAAFLRYAEDPEHLRVIREHIAPIVAERAALQYEVAD